MKKTVSGIGEELKAVKNAANAKRTAVGGGNTSTKMKATSRYMDAPESAKAAKQPDVMTSKGPKGGTVTKAVTPAREDVTKGMGGRVIKDMR